MKIRLLLVVVYSLMAINVYAQTSLDKLVELFNRKSYEEIIQLTNDKANLSEEEAYYTGLSYYHLQDDANSVKYFDLAIDRNASVAEYYFYKGTSLLYLDQYQKAVEIFSTSIALDPNVPIYYIGKGDAYYNIMQLDSAFYYYQTALDMNHCPSRAYVMNAQVLSDKKDKVGALEAYYLAKDNIDPFVDDYINILYNIGTLEYQFERFTKSAEAYEALINLRPFDYQAMSKLIQNYFALERFEDANSYKEKLYEAYKKGALPKELDQMFCFDQFFLDDYKVMAFEKFYAPPNQLYYKHVFYFINKDGLMKMSVQTEHSPAIVNMGKMYVLGKNDDKGHHSYFDKLFDENFEYLELKTAVISVFENEIVNSSSNNKKKKKKKGKKKKKKD